MGRGLSSGSPHVHKTPQERTFALKGEWSLLTGKREEQPRQNLWASGQAHGQKGVRVRVRPMCSSKPFCCLWGSDGVTCQADSNLVPAPRPAAAEGPDPAC